MSAALHSIHRLPALLVSLYILSPQPGCVGHGTLTLPGEGADGRQGAFGPDGIEPGRGDGSGGAGGGDGLDKTANPRASIEDAPPAPLRCDALEAGRRRLRRLTPDEFDRSVQSVVGLSSEWGGRFAADPVIEGFSNDADALIVTPLLADQLMQAAEAIATEAAPDVANAAGCGQGPDCAAQLVRQVGRRAYRRPLDEAEVEALVTLFELGSTDGGFVGGVRSVITVLLQSPHFVYRMELGEPVAGEPGIFSLTPFEVATELSFLVTGGPPDDALLDAAAQGELQVAAHVAEMLSDPERRAAMHGFVATWLDIDRVDTVPKDGGAYPEFDAETRQELRAETEAFTDLVLAGAGTLAELLTAESGEGRPGILTQRSFLATHARPDGGSPVHRGKAVRERLLCQPLPPPPPGVDVDLPAVDPALAPRARFEAHCTDPSCKGCHSLMDPVGHGFDGFDGVGEPLAAGGPPVDLTGEFIAAGDADGEFDGPAQLVARLAASDDVHDCFARQWLRFAFGTSAKDELSCVLPTVQGQFRESGGSIEALLRSLVDAPHFQQRIGDPDPPPPVAAADANDADDPDDPADVEGLITTELADQLTDDGIQVQERTDSEWGGGWCQTVVVTNATGRAQQWAVTVAVDGTINNLWNAVGDGDSGDVEFVGVEFNRSLEPGSVAEFGFCGTR